MDMLQVMLVGAKAFKALIPNAARRKKRVLQPLLANRDERNRRCP
jgi:hypothetical protein